MTTQPFEYLDKACLAATSGPLGCSNAPTWELHLDGQLPAAAVQQALRWLCVAYPTCGATVVPLDGTADSAKHFAWSWSDEPPIAQLFEFHDLRDQPDAAADRLRDAVHDRFLDLFARPPLQLILAWLPGNRSRLFVKQHHGLADGRAMIELLPDLAAFLNHALAGTQPDAAALAVVPRRAELDAFDLTPWQRRGLLLAGIGEYIRSAFVSLRRPLSVLRQNVSLDYSGGNRTLHVPLAAAQLQGWKDAAKRAGGNLNWMLAAAFLVANKRWNEAHGVKVTRMNATTAAETRPRGKPFRSFANHLAFHIPDIDFTRFHAIADVMPEIQRQVKAQNDRRAHLKRYLFERWFALTLKMADFRKLLFASPRTVVNLNFSNVLAIPIPRLRGPGWDVTVVRVSTPLIPRTAIVLTLTNYDGVATLNFNFKASVVTEVEVRELMAVFQSEVAQFVAAHGAP